MTCWPRLYLVAVLYALNFTLWAWRLSELAVHS